jgi:hypothetical protein
MINGLQLSIELGYDEESVAWPLRSRCRAEVSPLGAYVNELTGAFGLSGKSRPVPQ